MAEVSKFPEKIDISDECVHADAVFKQINEVKDSVARAEFHLRLFALYHRNFEFEIVPDDSEE